jgi:hypothetical protein
MAVTRIFIKLFNRIPYLYVWEMARKKGRALVELQHRPYRQHYTVSLFTAGKQKTTFFGFPGSMTFPVVIIGTAPGLTK